jgi:hypothetical protein
MDQDIRPISDRQASNRLTQKQWGIVGVVATTTLAGGGPIVAAVATAGTAGGCYVSNMMGYSDDVATTRYP